MFYGLSVLQVASLDFDWKDVLTNILALDILVLHSL